MHKDDTVYIGHNISNTVHRAFLSVKETGGGSNNIHGLEASYDLHEHNF